MKVFSRWNSPMTPLMMADTGITTRADVVIPQVISGMVVMNALFAELPLLRSPYVVDMSDESRALYTDGGDHITLLTQEFAEGTTTAKAYSKNTVRTSKTGNDGTKIKIGSYQENVTDKTVPIEYDRYTMLDAARQANVNGFIGRIVGQSQAETIQDALIAKANAAGALELDITGEETKTLTVDAILRAKLKWGDKSALFSPGNRPGLFVHSKQFEDLAKTDDYKKLGTAATASIVQIEQQAGAVAVVHGVVLFLMDSIPTDDPDNPTIFQSQLLAPGALGLLIKLVETGDIHKFPGTTVEQVDTNFRFVTTRFRRQPVPVVRLKTN